jgi:hypothetical protein
MRRTNQDQQNDETGGDHLIDRAAAHAGDRIQNRSAMDESDQDLLDDVQDYQQQEKDEPPVQRRPDERLRLEPFANVKRASHQDEFGADQGLGEGEAERREGNAMRLQNRRLQISDRGEADPQISRDNGEFRNSRVIRSRAVALDGATLSISVSSG